MGRSGRGRIGARAGDREEIVSAVIADALPEQAQVTRALIVDDVGGLVARALAAQDLDPTEWNRWAWRGRDAQAWPPAGTFDLATLRLSRDWATFEMQVRLLAARLAPDGTLVVGGANDEGIRSAERRLLEVFETVKTLDTRRKCRVLAARKPKPERARNAAPASWRERLTLDVPVGDDRASITLTSYPGVFSAGRLDEGTELLLSALPAAAPKGAILDFGCGHGIVGLVCRRLASTSTLTLLDVDALALEASHENVPDAELLLSDGWQAVDAGRRFSMIVSNPPIHRGRDEDFEALELLVRRAGHYLAPGGVLITVTQTTVGLPKLLKRSFRRHDVLARTGRFEVLRARP